MCWVVLNCSKTRLWHLLRLELGNCWSQSSLAIQPSWRFTWNVKTSFCGQEKYFKVSTVAFVISALRGNVQSIYIKNQSYLRKIMVPRHRYIMRHSRKRPLHHMRAKKIQISPRICSIWSAALIIHLQNRIYRRTEKALIGLRMRSPIRVFILHRCVGWSVIAIA